MQSPLNRFVDVVGDDVICCLSACIYKSKSMADLLAEKYVGRMSVVKR